MNKLNVDLLGGMYLDAEDWIFNQNGLTEAIKGLASMIGNNCWLSGITSLNVSGSDLIYNEGFVVIEGEVYYVPAATVPLNGLNYYFEVEETNDPSGYEVFQDGGSPQNTYKVRTVKIVTYASPQTENATRKNLFSIKMFDVRIQDIVEGKVNVFTKRQSWAQGTDSVAITASQNVIILDTTGNVFNLNIDNATVALKRFTTTQPNGTVTALRFTSSGTGTVLLGDGLALSNGFDTGGIEHKFETGEVALFIWVDGKPRLVNGKGNEWKAQTPAVSSTVLVSGINTETFRWSIDGKTVHCRYFYNATVTGAGDMSIIFTLPFSITGKSPQTTNGLNASFPDGSYNNYGSCRIGNGSDFTKMVHSIKNVSGIGTVQVQGSITFEIE